MFGRVAHDQYLYHYTRASTVVEHILPKMRLRFSSFLKTNDPRENKEVHFGIVLPHDHVDAFDHKWFQELITRNLKTRVRLLCFTADPPSIHQYSDDLYRRGFCHSRMWAQYADRHTGMCLIFDEAILQEEIQRSLCSITAVRLKFSFSG